jgi:hypothetical protein
LKGGSKEKDELGINHDIKLRATNKDAALANPLRHNAPFDTPTPPNRGTKLYVGHSVQAPQLLRVPSKNQDQGKRHAEITKTNKQL